MYYFKIGFLKNLMDRGNIFCKEVCTCYCVLGNTDAC